MGGESKLSDEGKRDQPQQANLLIGWLASTVASHRKIATPNPALTTPLNDLDSQPLREKADQIIGELADFKRAVCNSTIALLETEKAVLRLTAHPENQQKTVETREEEATAIHILLKQRQEFKKNTLLWRFATEHYYHTLSDIQTKTKTLISQLNEEKSQELSTELLPKLDNALKFLDDIQPNTKRPINQPGEEKTPKLLPPPKLNTVVRSLAPAFNNASEITTSLQQSVSNQEAQAKLSSVPPAASAANEDGYDLLQTIRSSNTSGGESYTLDYFSTSRPSSPSHATNPNIKEELETLKKRIENHAFDLGSRFGGKMIATSNVLGKKKNRVPDGIQKIHAEINKYLDGTIGARDEDGLLAYIKDEATKRTGSPTGLWGFFFNKRTDTTKAIYADLARFSLVEFNNSRSVSDIDQQPALALVRR